MLKIIYEDNHLIAINKKSGDIVQGDKTGDKTLSEILKDYIKKKYKKPGKVFLGIIHRLDRPTSGVVVFAKTSKGLTRMNDLFRNRKVEKIYWAIVRKSLPDTNGILKNYLKKDKKKNKSFVVDKNTKYGLLSELSYTIKTKIKNNYHLEIIPKTGRHHQIRVQLSNMNCPIKGDLKYRSSSSNKNGSICLHARKLSFVHPIKKFMIEITANPPEDNIWKHCN